MGGGNNWSCSEDGGGDSVTRNGYSLCCINIHSVVAQGEAMEFKNAKAGWTLDGAHCHDPLNPQISERALDCTSKYTFYA